MDIDDARLSEVKRHAVHAQKQHQPERSRDKHEKERAAHQAHLTLMQSAANAVSGADVGFTGRGRGMQHGRPLAEPK